jgi:hypothetical protein
MMSDLVGRKEVSVFCTFLSLSHFEQPVRKPFNAVNLVESGKCQKGRLVKSRPHQVACIPHLSWTVHYSCPSYYCLFDAVLLSTRG